MVTIEQKTLLTNNLTSIESVFNRFKTKNAFLGVYFTSLNKPWITFNSDSSLFKQNLSIRKESIILAFIYDTSQDFTVQTTTFLA
jgi:hypothetical protein